MKKMIGILPLILFAFNSIGQIEIEYEIKKIDKLEEFKILTSLETKQHEIYQKSYERFDSLMKADAVLVKSPADKEKKKQYQEHELKQRINFKENRARYFVEYIEEDSIVVDKTFSMPDTISTKCRCEIKNDTIQVSMGVWVFGGFFYNLKIQNKHFELIYIEDAHETKPYKYEKTDETFVEQLELVISNSSLTLQDEINLEIGEELNGYIVFKSPTYYVEPNYRGYSNENKIRKGITKGEIYFTCRLKEPFELFKE